MKRSLTVAVLALAFLLVAAMKVEDTAPLGVDLQIAPTTRSPYQLLQRTTPDTYTARALVYEVSHPTRTIVAELVVPPGGTDMRTVTGRGLEVQFKVGVSKTSDRAKTEVVAKRGGTVVLNQRSQVELRPAGRTSMPLQ